MTRQNDERDATIDRLLAGAMARDAAGPVPPKLVVGGPSEGECLDAETLAAWADDALDAPARTAAEAHAADCGRCQAMLAAMARTAPITTAPAVSWWTPSLRWLVPLAAAAAAVLVWTLVPPRDVVSVRQVSQNAEPASQAVPAAPAPRDSSSAALPESTVASNDRRELQELKQSPDAVRSRQRADANVGSSDRSADASRRSAEPAEADLSRRGSDLSRRSAESAKAEAAKADLSRRSTEGAKADADARETSAAADKKATFSPEPEVTRQRAAAATAAPSRAATPAAPPSARTFSFGAPETVIVSSNPSSRWRILQGGAVQRSSDGGATWQLQNTGATETLTGGSSPSPSVCWLVGPKGIVLRTIDGRSWTRVGFPEVTPLASIRATDADSATVTTEDGRQFVTDNGGRTWRREP